MEKKNIIEKKTALIFGIADVNSIAFSIAKNLNDKGIKLIVAYQKRIEESINKITKIFDDVLLIDCDVTSENDLDRLFSIIKNDIGKIDYIVHSIAFAKREDLTGKFIDTKKDNFHLAQDVSSYSLIEISRRASKVLKKNSSIITMTFQGSEKVFENYNVMGVCKATLEANVMYLAKDLGEKGIRINAISAGPIQTRAASAIKGFQTMLNVWKDYSMLKRNVKAEEIANTAYFLLSELSSGITGEIIHVDCGFNKVMPLYDKNE